MNGYELSSCIDLIRKLSNNNSLDLLFLFDSELLFVDGNIINKFSLSNLKKLLSIIKKERIKIKKIEIKF